MRKMSKFSSLKEGNLYVWGVGHTEKNDGSKKSWVDFTTTSISSSTWSANKAGLVFQTNCSNCYHYDSYIYQCRFF